MKLNWFKRKPLKKLTEREFLEKIIKICEENPHNGNPRNYHACVYDLNGKHCLIGEFLVREGIPIDPRWDDQSAGVMSANRVLPLFGAKKPVAALAQRIQNHADGGYSMGILRSWASVEFYAQDLLDDLPK